jgi:hypothetical protein
MMMMTTPLLLSFQTMPPSAERATNEEQKPRFRTMPPSVEPC